jgi:hypothetical protein
MEGAWPYVVVVGAKWNGAEGALTTRSVDNSIVWLPRLRHQCVSEAPTRTGAIMAKRKKGSKVQSRAKLRRANSAKRGKAHKAARAKATKRTVAKAKPKPAPVKKAARKVKQPVAPVVETAVVEMVEQPPGRNDCHGSRGDGDT